MTLTMVLQIKCRKIDCQRYVFVEQTGVFATHTRNDHLWLMTRDKLQIRRTLFNRFTNDGILILGSRKYRGFFAGNELEIIQKNFVQLSLLMPTDRDILTAIGELKNIRSGT
jgi:hypothetical protein